MWYAFLSHSIGETTSKCNIEALGSSQDTQGQFLSHYLRTFAILPPPRWRMRMRAVALFFVFLFPAITSAANPLPPGAVLRLGETRFRANGEIRHLRFTTDSQVLLGWVVGLDGQ